MREWTIVIPVPAGGWLTANPGSTRDTYGRADLIAAWRKAAFDAATEAKLPTGLDYVAIHGRAHYRTPRPPVRDRDNLRPSLKAAVDGIGKPTAKGGKASPGYGLVPDDSDRHIHDSTIRLGHRLPWRPEGHPIGELHLTIREIER